MGEREEWNASERMGESKSRREREEIKEGRLDESETKLEIER